MLVAGERVVLRDEELARAQDEKRHERRRPRPAADRLDEREPGPRERRKGRGDSDEDHHRRTGNILRAQQVVEHVAPLRYLRKSRVQHDESDAEQPRPDAEKGEAARAHRGVAHSRSRAA